MRLHGYGILLPRSSVVKCRIDDVLLFLVKLHSELGDPVEARDAVGEDERSEGTGEVMYEQDARCDNADGEGSDAVQETAFLDGGPLASQQLYSQQQHQHQHQEEPFSTIAGRDGRMGSGASDTFAAVATNAGTTYTPYGPYGRLPAPSSQHTQAYRVGGRGMITERHPMPGMRSGSSVASTMASSGRGKDENRGRGSGAGIDGWAVGGALHDAFPEARKWSVPAKDRGNGSTSAMASAAPAAGRRHGDSTAASIVYGVMPARMEASGSMGGRGGGEQFVAPAKKPSTTVATYTWGMEARKGGVREKFTATIEEADMVKVSIVHARLSVSCWVPNIWHRYVKACNGVSRLVLLLLTDTRGYI